MTPVAAPVNLPPRIYTGEEAGIRLPVPIAQQLPRYPGPVPPGGFKGVVEVIINETVAAMFQKYPTAGKAK